MEGDLGTHVEGGTVRTLTNYQWVTETKKDLERIENSLKRKNEDGEPIIIGYYKDEKGRILIDKEGNKIPVYGEPIMNEMGIMEYMGDIKTVINKTVLISNKPDLQKAYDDVFNLCCEVIKDLYGNAKKYNLKYNDASKLITKFIFLGKTAVEMASNGKLQNNIFGTWSSHEIIRKDMIKAEEEGKKSKLANWMGGLS